MYTTSITRSMIASMAQRFGLAVVLSAVILGWPRTEFHTASPPPEDSSDSPPGAGIVVRSEVDIIWLPQALLKLAQRQTELPVTRSLEELQTYLKQQGLANPWYALKYRSYQVNGEVAEVTLIRRPLESPEHFGEFQNVMAAAAGKPRKEPGLDFSLATVVMIPERLLTADPREAVIELMAQPD